MKKSALIETTVLFAVTLLACKILYENRGIPFLSKYLGVFIPVIFIYIPLLAILARRNNPEEYGITLKQPLQAIQWALIVSVIVLPIFAVGYHYYYKMFYHVNYVPGFPDQLGTLVVQNLFFTALHEEIFYRGYMQSRLNEAFGRPFSFLRTPFGFGLIYSNAFFALGHYVITPHPARLATFFPGLLFGWLRERTGGVIAPMLFHCMCNVTVSSFLPG